MPLLICFALATLATDVYLHAAVAPALPGIWWKYPLAAAGALIWAFGRRAMRRAEEDCLRELEP